MTRGLERHQIIQDHIVWSGLGLLTCGSSGYEQLGSGSKSLRFLPIKMSFILCRSDETVEVTFEFPIVYHYQMRPDTVLVQDPNGFILVRFRIQNRNGASIDIAPIYFRNARSGEKSPMGKPSRCHTP